MITEDLLILLFCTVDDWVRAHGLPSRPGPPPACSDSEILTFAQARELLGYDSERRFRRVLVADWRQLFPHIPAQSALNRRTRWLQGACEILREHWVADLPAAAGDWVAFDTTPLPVKHPSRVRAPHQWVGPEGLHARFGYCAAKALWFYGFRVAVLTPLLTPAPLVWALAPAAVNEREVAAELLAGMHNLHLLTDTGLRGRAFAAQLAEQRLTLLTPPTTAERATMPTAVRQFIAAHRTRIEGCFTRAKDQFHLEHHRALTFWGLVTRVSAKFAALTLSHRWRHAGLAVE